MYNWTYILTYLFCFTLSFYALSGIKFDKFMNVRQPWKVHLLLLLSAMGLGFLAGEFLLRLIAF